MRAYVGLAAVVGFLAACGGDSAGKMASDSGMTTDNMKAEPAVVTITASDFTFDAPDTISSGMVTFKLVNNGPELHHAQLMRLSDGKTYADLMEGMKSMQPGSPMPPWIHDVAGPNAPVPGSAWTITENLEPGTYAIMCFIPSPDNVPHMAKGMSRELTVVSNSGAVATAPVSDITVKMSDYAWDVAPVITSGKHMLRIENVATQSHEMLIVKLDAGKVPLDLAKWAEKQVGPPPATPMGGITGMAPGAVVFVPIDLAPGEYGLLCFLPDAKDGKMHTEHGMMKQFTVM